MIYITVWEPSEAGQHASLAGGRRGGPTIGSELDGARGGVRVRKGVRGVL